MHFRVENLKKNRWFSSTLIQTHKKPFSTIETLKIRKTQYSDFLVPTRNHLSYYYHLTKPNKKKRNEKQKLLIQFSWT